MKKKHQNGHQIFSPEIADCQFTQEGGGDPPYSWAWGLAAISPGFTRECKLRFSHRITHTHELLHCGTINKGKKTQMCTHVDKYTSKLNSCRFTTTKVNAIGVHK